MPYTYEYPRPSLTTDVILINAENEVLLIKRLHNPYQDFWALPGGFVDENEDLKDAALRELMEETSIKLEELTQFKTFGSPNRDPRGHTVSVVYYSLVNNTPKAIAKDDAKEAEWFDLEKLPDLAFDHQLILTDFIAYKKERD